MYRPAAASPCRSTRSSTSGSMFPPDRITTTGPSHPVGSASSAATPAAPAGSTTSLARSVIISSARDSSSSVTVRTSEPSSDTIENGTGPGVPTAMPSAMVERASDVVGTPAASDPGYAAARAAWTPTTLTWGAASAMAAATPATSPPPPSGMTTVRTSGTCSRISSASVPWPATTSGWSNGWMNTAPVRSASALAAASVSSTSTPTRRTSAPYSRVAATFGSAASTGM
ncbi:hypothetical protein D3C74_345750 [compost metagenome]